MPRSHASERASATITDEPPLHTLIDRLTSTARQGPIEAPPIRRVVVGVGADETTSWAVAWARTLGSVFDPHVTLVHVEPLPGSVPAAIGAAGFVPAPVDPATAIAEGTLTEGLLEEAAERLRDEGLDVSLRQVAGDLVRELANVARDEHADLLVVGSPPRGAVGRFLLGDVAGKIKDHADADLLVAKQIPSPGDVLCPVDGSTPSHLAAALALRIARAWDSKLHVLHVAADAAPAPRFEDDLPDVTARVLTGDPATVIEQEAETLRPSLIVCGHRGLGGIRSLVAGSVTTHVAHHVSQSLLLVKER